MEETTESEPAKPKRRVLPILLGLVLLLGGAGAGFFAAYSGLLALPTAEKGAPAKETADDPAVAFVPLEPLILSLGPDARSSHLRLRAELEVPEKYAKEVTELTPRVLDVLLGYLRALTPADVEARNALLRLRAQMLRRVQVVAGEDRVRDLLITEFVLN